MASVSKRKWTHNGKEKEAWAVRYYDAKGKHCQKTFKLKKEADAFQRKVETELSDGTHMSRSDGSLLRDACDEFLKLQEDRVKRKAIGNDRYLNIKTTIDRNVIPILGHKKAHAVTSVDMEDWFRTVVRDHGLAPTTAKERMGDVDMLFTFCRRRGYTKINPVPDAIKEIGRIPRVKVETFKVSQVKHLLELLEERPRYAVEIAGFDQPKKGLAIAGHSRQGGPQKRAYAIFRCMVHIAAFMALRVSEIRALRRHNVDFERKIIMVRHGLDGNNKLKGPKTAAGVRNVPMPDHIAVMIKDVLAEHYVENELEFIFATRGGLPIPMPDFRQWWYLLLDRAGLYRKGEKKQFHFHALRHFATSMWTSANLPPAVAAALAGHSHFDTTLGIYTHVVDDGDARGSATIEGMSLRLIAPIVPPVTH